MFQAQLLLSGQTVYSPWFARGGDYVRVTLDLIAASSGVDKLKVEVFTKNREEATDGAVATGTAIDTATVGRSSTEYSVLKELVRYKFTPGGTGQNFLFRMLAPVWLDAVKV